MAKYLIRTLVARVVRKFGRRLWIGTYFQSVIVEDHRGAMVAAFQPTSARLIVVAEEAIL